MSTTKTELNTILANEFLDLRLRLKVMKKREEVLKAHFNKVLDTKQDNNLIVNTAVEIIRSEYNRTSTDKDSLDYYFRVNKIDPRQFQITKTHTRLDVKAV